MLACSLSSHWGLGSCELNCQFVCRVSLCLFLWLLKPRLASRACFPLDNMLRRDNSSLSNERMQMGPRACTLATIKRELLRLYIRMRCTEERSTG